MQINKANGKKIITPEEYDKLSEEDKKNFKEMIYDENLGPGDDIEVSYRVKKAGFKGVVCDFWVQHHRLTEHGNSDTTKKKNKMAKYFRKKWGLK